MRITHGECGKSWTGARTEHCPACHQTFARADIADAHRVGDHHPRTYTDPTKDPGPRRCLTPEQMRGRGWNTGGPDGLWGWTEPPPVTPAQHAAREAFAAAARNRHGGAPFPAARRDEPPQGQTGKGSGKILDERRRP